MSEDSDDQYIYGRCKKCNGWSLVHKKSRVCGVCFWDAATNAIQNFRQAYREVVTGQTHPIETLWDEIDE